MRVIAVSDVEDVMGRGNGSVRLVPQAGGEVLKVSYLQGKVRVDVFPIDATIPLPARGVGGSEPALPPVS